MAKELKYGADARTALQAGVDMDMVSEGLLSTLKQSLEEGKVSRKEIDAACRRILDDYPIARERLAASLSICPSALIRRLRLLQALHR